MKKINQVSEHKHLGLFLSENMKWTTHIDYSIKRLEKNWDYFEGNHKI